MPEKKEYSPGEVLRAFMTKHNFKTALEIGNFIWMGMEPKVKLDNNIARIEKVLNGDYVNSPPVLRMLDDIRLGFKKKLADKVLLSQNEKLREVRSRLGSAEDFIKYLDETAAQVIKPSYKEPKKPAEIITLAYRDMKAIAAKEFKAGAIDNFSGLIILPQDFEGVAERIKPGGVVMLIIETLYPLPANVEKAKAIRELNKAIVELNETAALSSKPVQLNEMVRFNKDSGLDYNRANEIKEGLCQVLEKNNMKLPDKVKAQLDEIFTAFYAGQGANAGEQTDKKRKMDKPKEKYASEVIMRGSERGKGQKG